MSYDIRVPVRKSLLTRKPAANPAAVTERTWTPSDIANAEELEVVPKGRRYGGSHQVDGAGRKTASRFGLKPLHGKQARMPAFDAPAVAEGRTIYQSTVLDPENERVIKSGINQAKLGAKILKGRWKDMPLFSVTLEERKTCPTDCLLYRGCYGNGMPYAKRYRHGPELEAKIRAEVPELVTRYPAGFVVRLHTLGDFYSVEYVKLWAEMLDAYPQLHIFGYSARWRWSDPIARALLVVAQEAWDRFSMRFSNAPVETCSTVNIDLPAHKPADAIVCPNQLGQSESCATCGLCWDSERRIAFLRH